MTALDLTGCDEPWVVFGPASSGLAEVQTRAMQERGGRVHHFRAADLLDSGAVFREFATRLAFPGYFGHNWNAVVDCLGGLCAAVTGGVGVLCVVHDADLFIEPEHLRLFVSVLLDGAERSNLQFDELGEDIHGPPVAQHFLFLANSTSAEEIEARLASPELVLSRLDDLVAVEVHPSLR